MGSGQKFKKQVLKEWFSTSGSSIRSTYFTVFNDMVAKNEGEKKIILGYSKVSEFFYFHVLISKQYLLINCKSDVTFWYGHALSAI